MAHSFYSCREPFYFEQSGWGLVERHLWSNLNQRRKNIQHGQWSWCLHQLEHQFGWLRSQANNEDLLFQIRQSRSIHPLLTIKFSHTLCDGYDFFRLLQRTSWWKTMRSVSSVWRIRKGTLPHCFDISAKIVFKICELAHPCLRGSAPPYLIPHASERHPWMHIRTYQIGCGGHVKISRPRSQLDPGNFAISFPSAWNSIQVDFRDPGFSLITLRWKINAFLSSLFICSSNALHMFMFLNSRRTLFETIFNSFLIIMIIIRIL